MFSISFLVLASFAALGVPSQAAETCVAQDRHYSYEGYSRGDALRACRAESDQPRACYLHRCHKAKPSRPGRSGGLTREQQRSINDAILQQRCIAGGACRP